MKTRAIMIAALMLAATVSLTGCMSDAQTKQVADSYGKFIEQERYMPLQVWDFGTNGTGSITYTGLVTMRVYAPLDKLSIMPENPGTAREVVDGIVKLGAIGATAYGLHELTSQGPTTSTVNNNPAP